MSHYRHLNQQDRIIIAALRNLGKGLRTIARALGRSPSTISRELRRNKPHDGDYNSHLAHTMATFRRHERPRKIRGELEDLVLNYLEELYSPDQIAMLLWSEHRISLSHQTIYTYIWDDRREKGTLWKCLRYCGKGRHLRRYRRGPGSARRTRNEARSISHRPAHIDLRLRYGHWEADLVEGSGRKRPILVLLERKTRLVLAGFLRGKHSSEVARVARRLLRGLKVLTLTTDNGPEFLDAPLIEQALQCQLFYTQSYASWQKGSIENANGLLREFFPKGSSFTHRTQAELRQACHTINIRPRRILDCQSPASLLPHLKATT